MDPAFCASNSARRLASAAAQSYGEDLWFPSIRTGFVEIMGITRGTTNQPNLTVNEIAQALSGLVVNATVSMHTWEGNISRPVFS